ncbi:MAG: hypothetical protein K9M99_07780 [Candidatus Cloacimonetes bacterium]|nr:hypothetical protein [Candidatus Cloacimonadota bacterium]
MKKIVLTGVLLVLLLAMFADGEPESGDPLSFGGGVGSVIIGDQTYMRLRLTPELRLGKLGIGLDIDFLFTEEGGVRDEDWDDWQDYVNKLYYIRWSERGDVFFAKLGAFSTYDLGMGLVVNDYCNTLTYPLERQLGLMVGGKLPLMDMMLEGFTSNITDPTIFAGRVTIAPLHESGIPLLNKLRLGVTAAYDVDQYQGISEDEEIMIMNSVDTDDDEIPDVEDFDADGDGLFTEDNLLEMGFTQEQINQLIAMGGFVEAYDEELDDPLANLSEEDMLVLGFDYDLPLIDTKMLKLSHYAELAQIVDHGYGFIFPGFYSQFAIFHLNLEFRQYDNNFMAGYFDHYYDADRAYLQFNPDQGSAGEYDIFIKEQLLETVTASRGWYGKLRADIFNFLYLEAAYTDMYSDGDEDGVKSLIGTAGINTKIIPKLKNMEFKYYQVDVSQITDIIAPHVIIQGTLRYELSPGTNLMWQYQERYVDYDNNDKIEGDEEIERDVSIGVEFRF